MRKWLFMLAAVLSGNLIYFVVFTPVLPPWLRHRPYHLDAGLVLDFALCVAILMVLGWVFRERPSGPEVGSGPGDEHHRGERD